MFVQDLLGLDFHQTKRQGKLMVHHYDGVSSDLDSFCKIFMRFKHLGLKMSLMSCHVFVNGS